MSTFELELIEIPDEENELPSTSEASVNQAIQDSEQSRREQRNALANLLNFVLFLGYVTFTFPFARVEGGIIKKLFMCLQKFMVAFVHTLFLIQMVAYVRQSLPGSKKFKEHPTLYVDFGFFSSNIIYVGITIKILWCNLGDFDSITEFIQNENMLPVRYSMITTPSWLAPSLFFAYLFVKMLICTITGFNLVEPLSRMSISYLFRRLVAVGRYNFFVSSRTHVLNAPGWGSITTRDYFLGILAGIGKFFGFLMFEMVNGLMFACAIQLWICCSQLCRNIENSRDIGRDWPNIYRQFQSLKVLSILINKALGDILLWYVISVGSGSSVYMHSIFVVDSYIQKYYVISSLVVCVAILITFANCWKQIQRAKELVRLARNRRQIPQDEANNFLDDPGVGLMNPGTVFKLTLTFICAFALAIFNFVFITKEDIPSRNL